MATAAIATNNNSIAAGRQGGVCVCVCFPIFCDIRMKKVRMSEQVNKRVKEQEINR